MKQLKKLTTSKLFFDKYVNKVVIETKLATLFRDRNLSKVKDAVDNYSVKINNSPTGYWNIKSRWDNKTYSKLDVTLACDLISILETDSDYATRVEGSSVGVYTNSKTTVDALLSISQAALQETSFPKTDSIAKYLLTNPNTIISKNRQYDYKVKLAGLGTQGATDFKDWAIKMPKIKTAARRDSYVWDGGHVYVADSKTLTVCQLYLGKKIRRVDRIVLESEI